MKSIVQALFVGTASISYALGIAISPTAKDPNMTIFYGCLTCVQLAITAGFWLMFRKLDKDIIVDVSKGIHTDNKSVSFD